jgi:protein-disulfide isomerase-like protein with CxxC motif
MEAQDNKPKSLTERLAIMKDEQRAARLEGIEFSDDNADEIIKLVFGHDAVLVDTEPDAAENQTMASMTEAEREARVPEIYSIPENEWTDKVKGEYSKLCEFFL